MKNTNSRISDLGFVSIANLFSAVFGGLFWIFLAPLLSVEVFGEISYDFSIPSMLGAIAIMGLTTTVTTYTAKGNENLKYQANFLVLIASIVVSIPLFFIDWILAFFLITNNFFHMTTAMILGTKSYKEYSIIMIGSRILQITLSLILYNLMGEIGILIGYVISFIIFSYRYLLSIKIQRPSISEIRPYWKFTLYNYAGHISSVIYAFADKILIGTMYGFEELGMYALAFYFISALSFLPSSLSGFLLPEEASGSKTNKIRNLGIIGSILITIGSYFGIPVFIEYFLPNYHQAIPLIQIMILSLLPATVSAIYNSKLLAIGNGKIVLIGMIIFISIHLTGITILGSIYGMEGLGISIILAHTIQAIFLLIIKNK